MVLPRSAYAEPSPNRESQAGPDSRPSGATVNGHTYATNARNVIKYVPVGIG